MKKIAIILFAGIFFLASCKDWLDINKDPNFPATVEDYLILPAAQVSIASVFSADYGLIGSFWAQHWAQNNTSSQYKTFESYTIASNDNTIDFSYRELYYGGLADNEIILLESKADSNWGLYLMTATMKAYTFQYLVDLYDNVPYSEAFKGDQGLFNPTIDKGPAIYESIYGLLNEALAQDISDFNTTRYSKYDLWCGGDLNKWTQLANTTKLRILLRQWEANTDFARTEITNLLANGQFLTSDVQFTNFEDADSKSNPMYESDQRQLNTTNNIRANITLMSYLTANGDSRRDTLFELVGPTHAGLVTGSYEVATTVFDATAVTSRPRQSPTMPINLTTVAESEFLQAEAYLRLGDVAAAQQHYEAGVTSSFQRMGTEMDSTLLTTGGYAFPTTGFDAQLEAIIMQKWVDCADGQRGIEAFIEMVRTGYPKVSEVSDQIPEGYLIPEGLAYVPGTLIYSKKGTTGGRFPVRFPYPDSELNYNSNAAEYKALRDADVLMTNVWWNK